MQVCPRNNLLSICHFMAQLQNITFNITSFVLFRVVFFNQTGPGIVALAS